MGAFVLLLNVEVSFVHLFSSSFSPNTQRLLASQLQQLVSYFFKLLLIGGL